MSFWRGETANERAARLERVRAECNRNAAVHRAKLQGREMAREARLLSRDDAKQREESEKRFVEQVKASNEVNRQLLEELKRLKSQAQPETAAVPKPKMGKREAEARMLLGIALEQVLTAAIVNACFRHQSKGKHPDQNPDVDPAEFVRLTKARDYLLSRLKS